MLKFLRWKDEKSLRSKTLKSGALVFSYRIIQQLLNLVKLIILARILTPKDFGIMGIALLTITVINIFTQTGIYQALIQKKGEVEEYLSDAWTFLVLRGVFLSFLLLIISPLIGKFFNSPESVKVLQTLSIYFLFQSSVNTAVIILFQKELEFGMFFIYQFLGISADFIISITLALVIKNVWALVFGFLAKGFVLMVSSFFIHPYKPRLILRKKVVFSLFSFGKWILASGIILFLLNQGGDVIIGKVLGVYFLGLYQIAFKISNLPTTEIIWMLSQVTFPAYSKIQDMKEKLKKGYFLTLSFLSFFSFLFLSFILAFARIFTLLFLGKKWIDIVEPMQILGIWGLLRAHSATTGPLFQAVGYPRLATKYQFLRLIVFGIVVYPFTKYYGILGTSFAVLISAILIDPFALFHAVKIVKGKMVDFLKVIYTPFLSGFISSCLLILIQRNLIKRYNFYSFFTEVFMLLIIYFLCVFVINRFFKNEYIMEMKNIIVQFLKGEIQKRT